MLNIVLLEPEIPANTGNIGRTCVAAGAKLHLIEPMGFQINEKQVKRAGLDYWDKLDYTIYDSYPDFLEKNPGAKIYMATTKAKHIYSDVSFEEDCYIMFGKESAGIPEMRFWWRMRKRQFGFRCMARFDRSIWVILLQLFCTKHSGSRAFRNSIRWGIFIILIGMMARYRKLQRELFEKSSLFLQLFQMLNRYVGRKGKKQ